MTLEIMTFLRTNIIIVLIWVEKMRVVKQTLVRLRISGVEINRGLRLPAVAPTGLDPLSELQAAVRQSLAE